MQDDAVDQCVRQQAQAVATHLEAHFIKRGFAAFVHERVHQEADRQQGQGHGPHNPEVAKHGQHDAWNKTQAVCQVHDTQLNWGVFANRDWVESFSALQQGIHYNLVGGNVDYQVHPRMTLIGSLAHTHFSDGHDRQQQRARAVWDAWPDQGITLQWAYKHQLGETVADASQRYYFNPDRLDESMGLIGWRRRIEGWQWYARLGEGRQSVNGDDRAPARLAELQLTSPVQGHSFVKLRAGRSETAGLNGPGYVYKYLDAQWIWRLGR